MALTNAIFLDMACTMQDDVLFSVGPRRMTLATGVKRALQRLGTLDLPLVLIGSQPDGALGYFDREDLNAAREHLGKMFLDCGVKLAGFYCCPHRRPDTGHAEYSEKCNCRKPEPGMLLTAAIALEIDLKKSWCVGELLDDVEAGQRAGCTTVLIMNGRETEWSMNKSERVPHFQVPDMAAFCELLINEMSALKLAENAAKSATDRAALSAARENAIRVKQSNAVVQMAGQQLELLMMGSAS